MLERGIIYKDRQKKAQLRDPKTTQGIGPEKQGKDNRILRVGTQAAYNQWH